MTLPAVEPPQQANSIRRSKAANRSARFAAATLLAATLVIAPALAPFRTVAPIPAASAACPGAEVAFARGREEPPGVGLVGGAFVNSLRSKVPNMSIGSYPLPADVHQHVAAVALFGNGTRRVLGPVPGFSPAFASKTIDQCADGDPICANGGMHWHSHLQPSYIDSGLVDQAASFVAGKL